MRKGGSSLKIYHVSTHCTSGIIFPQIYHCSNPSPLFFIWNLSLDMWSYFHVSLTKITHSHIPSKIPLDFQRGQGFLRSYSGSNFKIRDQGDIKWKYLIEKIFLPKLFEKIFITKVVFINKIKRTCGGWNSLL